MNRGILFSLPSSFFGWGTPYHSDSSPLADRESGKPSTVVAPPSGHPKPLVARQRSHCNSFRTFFLHILSTKGLFCFLQNMGMSHECWFPCIGSTQVLAVIIGEGLTTPSSPADPSCFAPKWRVGLLFLGNNLSYLPFAPWLRN